MDDSDTDTNVFKVDHSRQYQPENIDTRIDRFFQPNKKILNDQLPRKVIYGPMEQQSRTLYQVVKPYLWVMAQATGQAATTAGKGIYAAFSTGAQWMYNKFVNNLIPFTVEELPKLFFIIKNGKKNENIMKSSDSFHVLQIDENDYDRIQNKEQKKKKKRIIVPLGANEDPQFIKFLQKQNYVPNNSFPIGVDSDDESESFMVPSANFMLHHHEAIKKNQLLNENQALQQYQTQEITVKPQKLKQKQPIQKVEQKEKQNQNKHQNTNENEKQNEKIEKGSEIKSIIDNFTKQQEKRKEVQNYKRVQKKFFKLQDCYIFELEGQNSIQYDLLDGIQKDDNTKCGYLIKSTKFNLSDYHDGSQNSSGQAPLLVEKIVDNERKVKVQIPLEVKEIKGKQNEERQIYLA